MVLKTTDVQGVQCPIAEQIPTFLVEAQWVVL
jgi:hypothetical protein